MNILLRINACDIKDWEWLLALLVPFILGYLIRFFIDQKYLASFKRANQLETSLLESDKKYHSLAEDLELAKAHLRPFTGINLDELQNRISSLENNNAQLIREIQDLKEEKSEFEKAHLGIHDLKTRIVYLEDENSQLKEDLKTAFKEKENQGYSHKLPQDFILPKNQAIESEEEISLIPAIEKSEEMNTIPASSTDLERVQKELEDLRIFHQNHSEKWATELEKLQDSHSLEIQKWNHELENTKQEIQMHHDLLSNKELELDLTRQKLQHLQEIHQSVLEEKESIETDNSVHKESLKSIQSQLLDLETLHKNQSVKNQEMETLISELNLEIESLKSRLQEFEQENQLLKNALEDWQNEKGANTLLMEENLYLQNRVRELEENSKAIAPSSPIIEEKNDELEEKVSPHPSYHVQEVHSEIGEEVIAPISENHSSEPMEFISEVHSDSSSTYSTSHLTGTHEILEGEEIPLAPIISDQDPYLPSSANYIFRLKGHLGAENVFVVGNFEDWGSSHCRMHLEGEEWIYAVYLSPETYLYKFLVDGEWILDPENPEIAENEFGTGNSVVHILA